MSAPLKVEVTLDPRRFDSLTGEPRPQHQSIWIRNAQGYGVALMMSDQEESLARVFAAAPEMLEALRDVERQLCLDGHATRWESGPTNRLAKVRAVIAKAEGRTAVEQAIEAEAQS